MDVWLPQLMFLVPVAVGETNCVELRDKLSVSSASGVASTTVLKVMSAVSDPAGMMTNFTPPEIVTSAPGLFATGWLGCVLTTRSVCSPS